MSTSTSTQIPSQKASNNRKRKKKKKKKEKKKNDISREQHSKQAKIVKSFTAADPVFITSGIYAGDNFCHASVFYVTNGGNKSLTS